MTKKIALDRLRKISRNRTPSRPSEPVEGAARTIVPDLPSPEQPE
jgi:hypothetical protein